MNENWNKEDKLKSFIDCSRLGTWEWDIQTGETVLNELWAQMLGYTLDELIPTDFNTWKSLIHPDDFKKTCSIIDQHLSGIRSYYDADYRMRHKDGHWVWVNDRGKVVSWTEDGKPWIMFGTHADITGHKQTEEALRRSEEKHRLILQGISEKIFSVTHDGIFRFVNEAFAASFGLTAEDIVGKTCEDLFPPDEVEERWKPLKKVFDSGKKLDEEKKIVLPSGEVRYFHSIIEPVLDTKGKVASVQGIVLNITERKKAEEALMVSEARLRKAQKVAHVGNWSWNKKTNRLDLSDEMYNIYGLTIKTDTPDPETVVMQAVHPQDRKFLDQTISSAIHGKERISAEYRIVWPDKSIHTVWTETEEPVLDENSNVELLSGITQDITERKRMEEILVNSQKLESLGALAGGIAHDFNNLLGGIYGYIDLAADKAGETDIAYDLSKALATIDRARILTRQLLTFAKGGAPVKKLGRLSEFIEETARFVLSGSNVSCGFFFSDDLWQCEFDGQQMGQVIDNLVINALQAMPEGGRIEISAENCRINGNRFPLLTAGNYIKVVITDHGRGMSKEILPNIFDPFFSTKTRGHGLGLATCHSIIRRHGGCIQVESEVEKGSSFTFYLPALSRTVNAEPADLPEIIHNEYGTILLMDDEKVIRETASSMLKDMGYEVYCVKNSDEAIRVFKIATDENNPFDACILDLTIPGGEGGKEAVREIRLISTETPVFVASGYADDPVMANPAEYGFNGSICKPFTKRELTEFIHSHLTVSPLFK